MIQSVRGTKDILPGEISRWHYLEKRFQEVCDRFCYKEIRTPIFEATELFVRGVGEQTDAVGKEMYTLTDKGSESISLRPEGTAPIVRSLIQHNLLNESPVQRLWYVGPFFRYERPQKGRQRQFHQFGAELIGSPYPEADAEIIDLASETLRELGIEDFTLMINTLGNKASRERYRAALVEFLNSVREQLSADSQNRIEKNPLRVLDSKNPGDREATKNAPSILEYLDEESSAHFESVKSLLEANGIKFIVNNRLVRGLDYYSHTVFEFISGSLGAQDALGGGGRYDGLFEQLGGKPAPAIGFALGLERLQLAIEEGKIPLVENIDIFVVGDLRNFTVQKLCSDLRKKNYSLTSDLLRRSYKAQFREANRLGAKIVLILGEDELTKGTVMVKNMTTSEQVEVQAELLEDVVHRILT